MWLFCYLRCLWKRNKGFKSELWKWGGAWEYIKFKDAAPFSARFFRMFLNSHHHSPALPLCEKDEKGTGMWDSLSLLFKLLTHCVPQGFYRFFRVLVSKKPLLLKGDKVNAQYHVGGGSKGWLHTSLSLFPILYDSPACPAMHILLPAGFTLHRCGLPRGACLTSQPHDALG